ncbi:MAG: DUF1284 domain-containing protein [Candidatus Aenigmatarchaeota archaeon]
MELRPHHLVCLPRYYRGGYDKRSSENNRRICNHIRTKPTSKFKLIMGCDDVCSKCPHMKDGLCRKTSEINKWIKKQDSDIISLLKMRPDTSYTFRNAFNISIEKITNKELKTVCKGCEFLNSCLKWGVNNSFRKDIDR